MFTRLGYWLQDKLADPDTRAKTIGLAFVSETLMLATAVVAIVLWVVF